LSWKTSRFYFNNERKTVLDHLKMTSNSCSSLLGWMGFFAFGKSVPEGLVDWVHFKSQYTQPVVQLLQKFLLALQAPKYFNYATRSYYINQVLGSLSVSSKIGIYKDWSCRLTFDVFIVEGRKGYVWRWCQRLLGYLTHRGSKLANTCFDYTFLLQSNLA
jgi:hypothetical protein